MNKIVKRKLIGSILCLILGVIVFIYAIINKNNIGNEIFSYLCGFTVGIVLVGVYILIISVSAIKNPNKMRIMENNENDERLIAINDKAMSISFRICILAEAIISIICSLTKHMEFAKYFGWLTGIELIIYLIIYFIYSKKN